MSRSSGHARQKMGRVYEAPKPSMHRPFKKNSYKKKLDFSLKKTFARFCDGQTRRPRQENQRPSKIKCRPES